MLSVLQEDKFKFYFSQLSHVVREYEAVMAKVGAVTKPAPFPVRLRRSMQLYGN
jgi:hypothetical protein